VCVELVRQFLRFRHLAQHIGIKLDLLPWGEVLRLLGIRGGVHPLGAPPGLGRRCRARSHIHPKDAPQPQFPAILGLHRVRRRAESYKHTSNRLRQRSTRAKPCSASSATNLTFNRISQFQGSIKRTGSPVGNPTGGSVSYSNNLEKIETIRDDGLIEGADPTIAALTGKVDVRFADTTLIDLAAGGTPVDLEFAYTLSAQAKLGSPRTRSTSRSPSSRSRARAVFRRASAIASPTSPPRSSRPRARSIRASSSTWRPRASRAGAKPAGCSIRADRTSTTSSAAGSPRSIA
jgi:hypothetical protein